MESVHIVGVNHFLQWIDAKCWSPAGRVREAEQKASFRGMLNEMVIANQVGLIAEEEKPGQKNLGAAIVEEHHLNYIELTMPISERKRRGINTETYERRPETKAHAYREFEDYMFGRIAAVNARVTLAICGRRHMHGLEERVRGVGVKTFRYDVCDYDWWHGIPIEDGVNVVGYDQREDES